MRRFFEKISLEQFNKDFKDFDCSYDDIILPRRLTKTSAAYDFYLPFDVVIEKDEILKLPTGVKVSMHEDEMFDLYIRSGVGFKYNIRLCNQVGIIDCDYYNNPTNEGDMWIAIQNHGSKRCEFKKGDRLIQGVFQKYLITDDDNYLNEYRVGGLGSTNREDDENER